MRARFIVPLVAAIGAIASPALAQTADTDTGEVAVDGNVSPLCLLGEPSQATVDLGNMIATSGTRAGHIRAIANQGVTLPGSFCNYAGSVLTVETTALVETSGGTTSPPAGFARAVNFTASAGEWGGNTGDATSAATTSGTNPTSTGSSAVQDTPRQTDIAVTLSGFSVPTDGLLVAGSYSGLVRVTLGPAAVSQ